MWSDDSTVNIRHVCATMVVSTRLVSVTSHVYDEPPTISVAERKVMSVLHGVDFLIE